MTVVKPERRTLRRFIEQPGTVHAYEEAPLFVKLAGYVSKVNADIGDEVKVDDVLAELAVPELVEEAEQKKAFAEQTAAEVEQARKALAAAEAGIAAGVATVSEMSAGLRRAEGNYQRWDLEAQRMVKLVQSAVLDKQTRDETEKQFQAAGSALEETRAKLKSAEALLTKLRAERDKAGADVVAAEARRKVALADARRLQALLCYTQVRAPFAGCITRRRVDAGHFLQPPSGPKAEPLFVVARLDKVRVAVDVPEDDAALVQTKAPATVRVQALGGPDLVGQVSRVAWGLDPGMRTLRTEIDLPNAQRRLRPGMYALASIAVDYPDRLALPAAALVKQGDAVVCFRIQDGKAVRLPVRIGVSDGAWTEVLSQQEQGKANAWAPFSGTEAIAAEARLLTDGAAVSIAAAPPK